MIRVVTLNRAVGRIDTKILTHAGLIYLLARGSWVASSSRLSRRPSGFNGRLVRYSWWGNMLSCLNLVGVGVLPHLAASLASVWIDVLIKWVVMWLRNSSKVLQRVSHLRQENLWWSLRWRLKNLLVVNLAWHSEQVNMIAVEEYPLFSCSELMMVKTDYS